MKRIIVKIDNNDPYKVRGMFSPNKANKKIVKSLKILDANARFLSELRVLQIKWRATKKTGDILMEKFNDTLDKACHKKMEKGGVKNMDELPDSNSFIQDIVKNNPIVSKQLEDAMRSNALINKGFNADIISLVKKYDLLPRYFWSRLIEQIVLEELKFPSEILTAKNPIVEKELEDAGFIKIENCEIFLEKNTTINEDEIFIKIFPYTSLGDIRKSWKAISKLQKSIRKTLNIKSFYPLDNLDIAKKIKKLDREKISDWEKAEKIWGEITGISKASGAREIRRKNRLKQIRYQYKKKGII